MTRSSAAPADRAAGVHGTPGWSRFIPWFFVAGFAIVIAVNGTLIYFAQSSFSGLDTEHPYERGLDYNRTLAAAAAQAELGWHSEVTLTAAPNGRHEVAVRLADDRAQPIDGLEVEVYLRRPANSHLDLSVPLQRQGNGRYAAEVALPALGQWEVRIVARDGELSWQESERLFAR